MTFSELGLSAKVLKAVEAAGYTTPTPIQAQAIPVAVTGRDVLGIAQTGTGKTASFVLPMLTRLERGRARARMPRSLILAPTRELAAQVAEHFEGYGADHKLTVALLIGGVSFDEQFRKLDRGADVLIATPGRMLDHFSRGKILLNGVEILVIDEADRMLDMGFIPDIERICSLLPPRRQTLFFSATMPAEIQRLVARFLDDPVRIEVARQSTTAATITQRFLFASSDDREKRAALRELIASQSIKNAIVFANRKRDVAVLLKSLLKHGFNAGGLHGDMDQFQRTATLDAFRKGEITLLAASDVAARGLDIPEVSHVFNYDVPVHAEDYVHRIGRTGRAGREGFAATLVTLDDLKVFREIEKNLGGDLVWIGEGLPEDAEREAKARKRGRGRGEPGRERTGERERGRERSGRSGDGRRERGGEREPRGVPQEAASEAQTTAAAVDTSDEARPEARAPIKTEAGEASGGRRREAERQGERQGERRENRGSERRGPRERGSERPRRQNAREEQPDAAGDHLPAFLLRPVPTRS
ncbi:MAG: DEAD/DEAH box helicase [Rhizobiales bacterium]|nr:DEAD/DEAH box helicase [Hyphomicrobiales bacterium]